ncbi:MAG: tetratricopeptide repeat protein [Actinomycetota bacterium]|nr:tetratricopeptide repeat protein [Actinomycetota bacterium]
MTELGPPPVPTRVREEIVARARSLRDGEPTIPLVLAGNHRGILGQVADLAGDGVRVLRPAANTVAARRTLTASLGAEPTEQLVALCGPAADVIVPIVASVTAADVEVGPVVEKALGNRENDETVLPALVRDVLATSAADTPTVVVFDAVDQPPRRLLWDLTTYTLAPGRVDDLLVIVGTDGPETLERGDGDDPLAVEARVERQVRAALAAGMVDRLWSPPLDADRVEEWLGSIDPGLAEQLVAVADGDDVSALRFWKLWTDAGHVTRDGDRWVRDDAVAEPVGADIDAVIEAQSIPETDRATTRSALRIAALCGPVFSGTAVFTVAAAEAGDGVGRDDVEDLVDLVTPDGSSTDRWLVRSVDHVKVGRSGGETETHWRYLFGSPDHQRLLRSEVPPADRPRLARALLSAAVRAHGTNPPYLPVLASLARTAEHPVDAGRLMTAADAEADVRLVRVRGRLLVDAAAAVPPVAGVGEQLVAAARALLNVGAAPDAELVTRAALDLDEDVLAAMVRATAQRLLGVARREQGDRDEAAELLRVTATEQRDRLADEPDDRHRRGLAAALFDLGVTEALQRDLDGAARDLGEAVELLEEVGGTDEQTAAGAAGTRDLAMARRHLGVVQRDRSELDDALANLREAVDSLRTLTERQPTAIHQRELALALRGLGSTQRRSGDLPDAIASLEDGAARIRAVALTSRAPNDVRELGRALHELGVAQREHGMVAESVASLTLAQRQFADLVKNQRTPQHQRDLANATKDLEAAKRRNGKGEGTPSSAPPSPSTD